MTERTVRYSCWLGALAYAAGAVVVGALGVGLTIAFAVDRGNVDPIGIVFCGAVALGIGFFSWWWVGCEVTVEGTYVAWRSLLRRRWIGLDRLTYVTAPGWFGTTMTLDTDDGGRLHVLVVGGYRGSARAFAANFAGPPARHNRLGPAARLPISSDEADEPGDTTPESAT